MKYHLQLFCFRDFQSPKQPKTSLFFYLHSKSVWVRRGVTRPGSALRAPLKCSCSPSGPTLLPTAASRKTDSGPGVRPQVLLSRLPRRDRHGQELTRFFPVGGCGQILSHFLCISPEVGGDECHSHEPGGLRTLGNDTDMHSCPVTSPPTSAVSSRDRQSRGAELSRVSLEQDSSRQLPTEDSLCWVLGAVWFRPY